MTRNKYILSREADNDLEEIFDYTFENSEFNNGFDLADYYLKLISLYL
jgi:plasmid stabilization system protein ParE